MDNWTQHRIGNSVEKTFKAVRLEEDMVHRVSGATAAVDNGVKIQTWESDGYPGFSV